MTPTFIEQPLPENRPRDFRLVAGSLADRLEPYLRALVEHFRPDMVILFGSQAYGNPKVDSDIDLLIVKQFKGSSLAEKIAIRKTWWQLPRTEALPAFDLIVVTPEEHRSRLEKGRGFYDEIVRKGIRLV